MFTVSVSRDRYLLCTATGDADLVDLCGLAAMVSEEARRTSSVEVVLDLLAATSRLDEAEKRQLETMVANAFRGLRVACVISSLKHECVRSRFAAQAGLTYSTFTDLRDAEHWVRSDQPAHAEAGA
ncbi:hypothetical protein LZ009_03315 [Ramlibacter sp. XY19]|uniref:hypothetical protein n=1 Tax=Ramlibacter paludis TaxID=2908000 RepID=UPI0023D9C821|nr:hypothetical protein [Ramlibacter paludis]MCG2591801.1 hypothetical protein [Ramlibacter paludis]